MNFKAYEQGEGNFEEDMTKELGWDRYPKKIQNQMHNLCYERSHSGGREEVFNTGIGLAEYFEGVAEMYEALKGVRGRMLSVKNLSTNSAWAGVTKVLELVEGE